MRSILMILICLAQIFTLPFLQPKVALASDGESAVNAAHVQYGEYSFVLIDEADLFSEKEEAQLREQMKNFAPYCNVVLCTIANNPYNDVEKNAENIYCSLLGYEDGTMFVIDMDVRQLCVYNEGSIARKISSSKCDAITDNVYTKASKGDYFGCASMALDQMLSLLEGERIFTPMKYISNVFISIIISLLTIYFIAKQTSKTHAPSKSQLYSGLESDFKLSEENTTFNGTTKRYSPRSNGTSGGGHVGGGHGGGGGGGHHSSSGSHGF